MRFKNIIVGAALSMALFVAAPAYGSSAQSGYSQPAGSVQQQISNDGTDAHEVAATTATKSDSGQLPFTGLDIALVVAAGGVLLAMGLGIRRISRSELV